MNDELEITGMDLAKPEPEQSSVEKFFAKLFGAKGVDVMSKFQGKVRESGTSREPRIMEHATKGGSGRKHLKGPGRDFEKGLRPADRLTRSAGHPQPVKIKPERQKLFEHGRNRHVE